MYEFFTRKSMRIINPSVRFSKVGRLNFNRAAAEMLKANGVERVLLGWDNQHFKVGIRPIAKKDPRAYEVCYGSERNSAYTSAKTFFDWMGYDYREGRVFSIAWNDKEGLYEINLPSELVKQNPQLEIVPRRAIQATRKK